jgi:hypothetical protein
MDPWEHKLVADLRKDIEELKAQVKQLEETNRLIRQKCLMEHGTKKA